LNYPLIVLFGSTVSLLAALMFIVVLKQHERRMKLLYAVWLNDANRSAAAAFTSFAALAVALGCEPGRVAEAYATMTSDALPKSAQEAVDTIAPRLRERGLIP
jgi:hypothetical protein